MRRRSHGGGQRISRRTLAGQRRPASVVRPALTLWRRRRLAGWRDRTRRRVRITPGDGDFVTSGIHALDVREIVAALHLVRRCRNACRRGARCLRTRMALAIPIIDLKLFQCLAASRQGRHARPARKRRRARGGRHQHGAREQALYRIHVQASTLWDLRRNALPSARAFHDIREIAVRALAVKPLPCGRSSLIALLDVVQGRRGIGSGERVRWIIPRRP
jgi:hypothetical protein